MKIYTRTGDKGETGIIGGRVQKDDLRVEAYGTVDELNSFIGMAMSQLSIERDGDLLPVLLEIQHELFDCGADLAHAKHVPEKYKVTKEMTDRLESWIDHYDEQTPDIQRFILPGGSPASAALHVCRTVCRRAERRVVTLSRQAEINEHVQAYLNRLSDFFFTAARVMNHRTGNGDIEYIRSAEVFRNK